MRGLNWAPKVFEVDKICFIGELLLILNPEVRVFVWLEVNQAEYDGKQRLKTLDQRFITEDLNSFWQSALLVGRNPVLSTRVMIYMTTLGTLLKLLHSR